MKEKTVLKFLSLNEFFGEKSVGLEEPVYWGEECRDEDDECGFIDG